MSSNPISLENYISCFYDNCISLENRRRAIRVSNETYDLASSQMTLFRFPLSSDKPLSSVRPPFKYVPFNSVYMELTPLTKHFAEIYHISRIRLSYFKTFANVFYPTRFSYIDEKNRLINKKSELTNGKLMELIFYTRYRRPKQKSMNEVFALRLWTPVPLHFDCNDSIIAFYKHKMFNNYIEELVKKILSFAMFIDVGLAELNFENNNPFVFKLSEWLKVYMPSQEKYKRGSDMTLALREVINKGIGAFPLEDDIELLKELIPETLTSVYSRDLINDFINTFPITTMRVGCRELNAQVLDIAKGIPNELIRALQKASILNDCHTAMDILKDKYCEYMSKVYMLPNAYHYYLILPSAGNINFGELERKEAFGYIKMPLYFWANGSVKYPLEAPSIGFVERMRFSDTDIYSYFEEIPHFVSQETPKDIIRHIYNSTISYLVPPKKYEKESEHFKNEYFETLIIPLNFYNFANYLWIGKRRKK